MDKDTIARLRVLFEYSKDRVDPKTLQPYTPKELRHYIPALLSIAERAADVEGIYGEMNMTPGVAWLKTDEQKAVATAVSRYVLGGE